MAGKRLFAAMAQSDASRGYKRPVKAMRDWPQWAFDAYVFAWLSSATPRNGRAAQIGGEG